MRLRRPSLSQRSSSLRVLAVISAAACGGGDVAVDARPMVDAIPEGCVLEATITEVPNPDPTTGNTAVIRRQTTAQPPAEIYLWNYVVTGTGTSPDLFQFVVPYEANLGSNPPLNIPALDRVPLDLVDACRPSVDYCMVGLGDFDIDTMVEAQFFYPNTGQVTITEAGDAPGGNFVVSMTASRFDRYTMQGGDIVDTDGDGSPDCAGTLAAFPAVTIPVTLPAVAPRPGEEHYGKFGTYTRR